MKLSEAIRVGSTFRPQLKGAYGKKPKKGSIVGSCALGAACEAIVGVGYLDNIFNYASAGYTIERRLLDAFPVLQEIVIVDKSKMKLFRAIPLFNDRGMSREDIANEVENLEGRMEARKVGSSSISDAELREFINSVTKDVKDAVFAS